MSLPLLFGIILLGLILIYIGSMIITVVAFRRGVGWGLGTILLPIVGLIVVFKEWAEAKNGFWVAVLGCMLAITPFAVGDLRDQVQKAIVSKFPQTKGVATQWEGKLAELEKTLPQAAEETLPSVAAQTAQLDQLDRDIAELTALLTKQYTELNERKKKLKTDAPADVKAFNQAAAEYTQRNAELKAKREERARIGGAQ